MSKFNFLLVVICVLGFLIYPSFTQVIPFWGYDCIDSRCIKVPVNGSSTVLSLSPCVLMCNEFGTLWPRPTNVITWNNTLLSIDRTSITIRKITPNDFTSYWKQSMDRFDRIIDAKIGDTQLVNGEYNLSISLYVESNDMSLDLDTDEQYQLQVETTGNEIQVSLRAFNYFGARHALETLSQLIVFDEFSNQLMILSNVLISDGPVYKHRGVLLDTVRQWFSLDAIKRTLDVMAMSKLNVFHWHITGSTSFAMVLDSHPELSQVGAFSPSKVYRASDIREIVECGRVRGIRTIPEHDPPAKAAEGFQYTNLITCFDAQPWEMYCLSPPCGHLDATKEEVYDFLHDVYSEMNEMFDDPPQFHMGGFVVYVSCWNTSADVRDWMIDKEWELTDDGYLKLLAYFQGRAPAIYRNITSANKKPVLWTSLLTADEVIGDFLSPDDYIVQVYTASGPTSPIPHILERDYDIIISNYDDHNLVCGFGNYLRPGFSRCSYLPWTHIYDNDYRRDFLVRYGINAESIQTEWCVQSLGKCRTNQTGNDDADESPPKYSPFAFVIAFVFAFLIIAILFSIFCNKISARLSQCLIVGITSTKPKGKKDCNVILCPSTCTCNCLTGIHTTTSAQTNTTCCPAVRCNVMCACSIKLVPPTQ